MNEREKERQMTRDLAVKTARKLVQPKAAEIDATGEFPNDLAEAFSRQGLFAILLPEEYGGSNGDIGSFCAVIEEVAKVSGTSALRILSQGVGAMPVLLDGNPSQKEFYFKKVSETNIIMAFALGPEEWDPRTLQLRAEKAGAGYLVSGRSRFVANGGVADYYTILALDPSDPMPESASAFVVDKTTPGLRFGKREQCVGMKGSIFADLSSEKCRVPPESRLGEEGGAKSLLNRTLQVWRTSVGALATGIADGGLNYAIQYAKERVQFGKPIISFQAIQFMIAEMATLVETGRSLVTQAVTAMEARAADSEKLSAVAKVYASEAAMRVTTDAVQILGGYGYMKDYPLERMMRDAKVTEIFGGSNHVQRQIIARELIKLFSNNPA